MSEVAPPPLPPLVPERAAEAMLLPMAREVCLIFMRPIIDLIPKNDENCTAKGRLEIFSAVALPWGTAKELHAALGDCLDRLEQGMAEQEKARETPN